MNDTQRAVTEWGKATFPNATLAAVFAHLLEEVAELGDEIADTRLASTGSIAEECADVCMLVMQLAGLCGFDLEQEVLAKLEVNRAREWAPVAGGYSKHLEVEA